MRPETGYCGGEDPWTDEPAPREDGLHAMDLATGQHRLIISLQQMAELQPVASMTEGQHYFTHPTFNEAGTRFFFWHRWQTSEGRHTRLYTASPDGTDICLLWDRHSHSTWLGDDRILAFVHDQDGRPSHWLFTDRTDQHEVIGEGVLTMNGHFTYSPDKRWLLTDRAPDEDGHRHLYLYHFAGERLVEIGRFQSMPQLTGPLRCDLHPRWSPDGTEVCIDSTHEGSRQMYVIDVGEIVRSD